MLKPGEAHVGIWPFHRRTLWKAPPEDNFLEYPCNSHPWRSPVPARPIWAEEYFADKIAGRSC